MIHRPKEAEAALLYLNFTILVISLKFYMASNHEIDKGLALGFFLGLAGILVHGITITNFYTILNMEAYALFLALLMTLYYRHIAEGGSKEAPAP